MAFLSEVVKVVDCSGIGGENHLSHALRVLPITPTTSAHSYGTKKVLRVRSSRVMETSSPRCHSCELVPAVPFPLPRPSTGTTGPARILRTLPRLLPCQPIHHLSRSTCEGLPPPRHRSSSSFRYLRRLVRTLLLSHAHVPTISQAVDRAFHRAKTP